MTPDIPQPLRLLIIDDDPVMLELLSLVLGSEGHTVITTSSAAEALDLLRADPGIQLVLTDMQMPDTSGPELARRIRQLYGRATPLLAMSANDPAPEDLLPFNGFLRKPFTPADFGRAVEASASWYPSGDGATVPREQPREEHGSRDLDMEKFERLRASMPAAQLRQMYEFCLQDAATRLDRMQAAADAGDAATFAREAHTIKGGCGMLGALELQALAGRMEAGALSCTPLVADFRVAAARLRRMLDPHLSSTQHDG